MMASTTQSNKKKTLIKILSAVGSLIFWVGLWQLVSMAINDEFFLPGPLSVLEEMISRFGRSDFWQAVGTSMLRITVGYLLGVCVGVLLTFLTSVSAVMKAIFSPLISVIRATPVVSFIILVFLFFDRSEVPVYIVMLTVAPMIWGSLTEGVGATDVMLKEMTSVYRFSFFSKLRHLYVPSLLPYFKASAVTSFGFAWKSGVAAEVICYPDRSIGKLIYKSRTALDSRSVFAITAVVIIISMLLEALFKFILSRSKRGEKV